MAEKDEGEKTKVEKITGRWIGGGRSVLKRQLENLGIPVHFARTAELELVPTKDMHKYKELLRTMLSKLMDKEGIEVYYNYIEHNVVPEVRKNYEQLQENYTDEICKIRKQLFITGTTKLDNNLGLPEDQGGPTIAPLNVFGQPRDIRLPNSKEIRFPDGSRRWVSHYGYSSIELWMEEYARLIELIFDEAYTHYSGPITDPATLGTLKKQFDTFKLKCNILLRNMISYGSEKKEGKRVPIPDLGFLSIYQEDKDEETRFSDFLDGQCTAVGNFRTEVMAKLPQGVVNFFYKRSYKVVRPYYWNDDTKEYEILTAGNSPGQLPIKTGKGEFEVGKDEFGMPFEVAGKNYKFDGEDIPEGTVLIDVFEDTGTPRRVDKKFIDDVPLFELAAYVLNEWDEVRDDWRDGRYHQNSLTVTDYLMAAHASLGGEWPKKRDPLGIKDEYRKYKMKLGDGRTIEHKRGATDLNPAFDMKSLALKKVEGGAETFMHFGKKRYYQTVEHIEKKFPGNPRKSAAYNREMAEKYDPVVTTRGLSMFIIDQISRRGKILSEIRKDLQDVSGEIGGFDFGPRTFAKPLNRDPFGIDVSGVNADIQKHSEDLAKLKKERKIS